MGEWAPARTFTAELAVSRARLCALMVALSKGESSPVPALGFCCLSHGPSFVKSQLTESKRVREQEREREREREVAVFRRGLDRGGTGADGVTLKD